MPSEVKTVDQYKISADRVIVDVVIKKVPGEFVPIYMIDMPQVLSATAALLDSVREKVLTELSIKTSELLDPKSFENLKKKFFARAYEILRAELIDQDNDTWEFLAGMLVHDMLGLGQIELMINDVNLEDIVVNNSEEPIWVYHKKYGWLKTNIYIDTESKIQNYSSIIGRRSGRQITTLTPLMDAHLTSGDRANSTLYPVSTRGNTISIRKFRRNPWVITDVLDSETMTPEVAAFLWTAIQYESNMIVAGGTGSGKTTFLNVLMPFIPPNQRIISIEDTREIRLPKFLHWVPMTTRERNPEGKGEVAMSDLLVNSLRMRPDRIIVGEIRKSEQAEVLFEAMHTGHSVYATLHADTAEQAYRRIINPPINVPETLMDSLHMIAVMFRDRRSGIRKVFQLAEIVPTKDGTKNNLNMIYNWTPGKGSVSHSHKGSRVVKELQMHTGMTTKEFDSEITDKVKILKWMQSNKVKTVDGVGKVIFEYYSDPDRVMKVIRENGNANRIIPPDLLKLQSDMEK